MSFSGAKLALFIGADLLTILRDDRPDIPYPAHWDLPGGGREGQETPQDCALRETCEEVGLEVTPSQLVWTRHYNRSRGVVWFFAAHLPSGVETRIKFGPEGQEWRLMTPESYCAHPFAVPHLSQHLQHYMADSQYRSNFIE